MTVKVKLMLISIIPWDLGMKLQFQGIWRVLVIWLVLFGMLERIHIDLFVTIEVEITVAMKVKLMLSLTVPWYQGMK